jgi:hypothetical protein
MMGLKASFDLEHLASAGYCALQVMVPSPRRDIVATVVTHEG